ncbi:hypothetical protein BBK82_12430 [Lentzea guizhouensis]|uniref:DUF3137 domain-containing protein n=1 Tax=Lentzea guizhouensis TaxID=1586287 RepID=A0A1B2HGB6_9PSEU|nr:hypothetical protein [Lentzea guizhouensis]ANZ36754.1 hypothetical protein BBK82_12430 [Lentzea guizhouensis]
MDLLKRIVSDFLLNPFFLTMVAAGAVFLVVRRWSHFRSRRKSVDEQIAALTPLAAGLGGTVVGPGGDTSAWSAGVRGPVADHVEGFFATLFRRSKPRWDLAVDVQRGGWHVRVTEASVRMANPSGYGVRWEQEHRIEVATARMAPMRIIRTAKYTSSGEPLTHAEVERLWSTRLKEVPSTAQGEHGAWQRVPLAPPMDQEFFVYGSDPASACRELNFDALHWLIDRENELPVFAQQMRLTFEAGFVYIVMLEHIEPDQLLVVIDTIVGLLDRMPGARPRHPAAAV